MSAHCRNGTPFNDTLIGDAQDNKIQGEDGSDQIFGLAGDDDLEGGNGADTLKGYGGTDYLRGMNGNDKMWGGPGNDFFLFNSAPNASTNHDTITDFTHGQDKIDFSALAGLGAGLASTGTAPLTIDPHTLLAYVAAGSTTLYANTTDITEAIATADMEIHLIGVTTLADTDILHHT